MISTWTIPTEVDYATIDVKEFHSLWQECWRRQQEQTTLSAGALSIGKRIPLFIPLLIPNSAHYHSIVRSMNVS